MTGEQHEGQANAWPKRSNPNTWSVARWLGRKAVAGAVIAVARYVVGRILEHLL